MTKKNILSSMIIGCILFYSSMPAFADIYLTKDEEINYQIKSDNGVFFDSPEMKKYNYVIKRYTIHNETNDDYTVIAEADLKNQNDINNFLSLKTKSFEVSENTFMLTMCSFFFPPLLIGAVPSFLTDVAKTPKKAIQNRKDNKTKQDYAKSAVGSLIKAGSSPVYITLQNKENFIIPYYLTVKNNTTGDTITLKEPEKAINYSVKQENTKLSETNVNQDKYFKEYNSEHIYLSRYDEPMCFTLRDNNIIELNDSSVFMAGGYKTKIKNEGKSSYYFEPNSPVKYNTDKMFYSTVNGENFSRKMPLLYKSKDGFIYIIGGGKYPIEKYDINKNTIINTEKIPEAVLSAKNGFVFSDSLGNIIFGSFFYNDFLEKYNPKTNTIEKTSIDKIDGVLFDEDNNKLYFASTDKLFYIDKTTLKKVIYSKNDKISGTNIYSAIKTNDGRILIAEDSIGNSYNKNIYFYDENATEKNYIAENLYAFVQFFKFPYSENIYFFSADNQFPRHTNVYKIDLKNNKAVFEIGTNFDWYNYSSSEDVYIPFVARKDGTITISGNGVQYIYSMLEKRN